MKMSRDLIYDVGMHDGQDTDYYLQLGYRVVAIDANPAAIEAAAIRFQSAISAGRLTLVNRAVSDKPERRTFWVSANSEWSSFLEGTAKREGTPAESIMVECEPFAGMLERLGIPHYLKIDIEGCESFCIKDLEKFTDRPQYVSWEATYPGGIDQLREMRDLGYTRFKIIRQTDFMPVLGPPYTNWELLNHLRFRGPRKALQAAGFLKPPPIGSSGPFGERTPGRWHPWHAVARRWRDFCEVWRRDTPDPLGVWFDFHAAR